MAGSARNPILLLAEVAVNPHRRADGVRNEKHIGSRVWGLGTVATGRLDEHLYRELEVWQKDVGALEG